MTDLIMASYVMAKVISH